MRMVEWKKLSDVAVIKNGKDYKQLSRGTIPVYGTGGIMTYVDQFASDKPSVLLPRKGSVENVFYVEEPFWTVDTLYWTDIDTSKIIPKFFFISLQRYNLKEFAYGGARPSLSQQILYNLDIPLPSLSEQKRIVGILDTFTSSIENLKKQIAERRKQYEYYRDQLLDLEGKEGVEMKTLGEVCEIKGRIGFRGYTREDQVSKGEGALTLTATNIVNQRIDYQNNTYITWAKYNESPEIMVKEGDIIVCQRGSIGKIAIVENLQEKATINPQLLLLKNIKCNNRFLIHYLLSRYFQDSLNKIIGHGTVQMIAQKDLKELHIPLIVEEEQSRIVSILDTFEASISNLEAQLKEREKQYEYYRNKLLTFE